MAASRQFHSLVDSSVSDETGATFFRGDEWSLRALASMPSIAEHCDFFASTSRDKKFALRAVSNL